MRNSKSSSISYDMACSLESSWGIENADAKESLMQTIAEYAAINGLDLTKELDKGDYQFLLEDLLKRGLFDKKHKFLGVSQLQQTHVQALTKHQT